MNRALAQRYKGPHPRHCGCPVCTTVVSKQLPAPTTQLAHGYGCSCTLCVPSAALWVTSAATTATTLNTATTTAIYAFNGGWDVGLEPDHSRYLRLMVEGGRGRIQFRRDEGPLADQPIDIQLPDGSVVHVAQDGNFVLDDADARVVYEANRNKAFNPYVNASDLLAKFIRYCGQHGVRSDQMKDLPVGLFVNWLIVEAAEADRDPVPVDVVPTPKLLRRMVRPRCLGCGRYRRRDYPYCAPPCAAQHYRRVART